MDEESLKKKCKEIRVESLRMAYRAPSSHIACALSQVEILVALYYEVMKEEDNFILSKGHGCMSLYAVLADKGYFPKDLLFRYGKNGSILAEHPSPKIPGIDFGTGSLGHGLSLAVGRALARKIDNKSGKEFVLLGDGECNEGSVWEAAMLASNLKLDNIVAIVDNNRMQANGFIDQLELREKFESFGWDIHDQWNGNDVVDLVKILYWAKNIVDYPVVVIAETTKGKGVSFMENDLLWHYRPPNIDELKKAFEEIIDA